MSPSVRRFAGLVAIAGACGACAADSQPLPAAGHLPSRDGIQLFYRTMGTTGDTIVVVHGGPGLDHAYLAPDFEPLAETHVLVFYDQRGAGRSTLIADTTVLDLAAHIADLDALRRHFRLRRMTLLGHAWGGLLAARYALEHPDHVSKLVLANPAPLRRTPYMQQLGPRVRRWMDGPTLAEWRELNEAVQDPAQDARTACRAFWRLHARGHFADPLDRVAIGRMRGDFCTASNPALRNGHLVSSRAWASLGDWDWREDFRRVDVPVLVITGTHDVAPVEAMQEWADAFRSARLVVLERTGHYPHVEKPVAYFGAVTEFLR